MNICGTSLWHKAPPCASERSSDVITAGSELRSDAQGGALCHSCPRGPIMLRNSFLIAILLALPLHAESGADAWLRYAALDEAAARPYRTSLPAAVVSAVGSGPTVQTAQRELIRGIRGMLGRTLRTPSVPGESAIVLGTLANFRALPQIRLAGASS